MTKLKSSKGIKWLKKRKEKQEEKPNYYSMDKNKLRGDDRKYNLNERNSRKSRTT